MDIITWLKSKTFWGVAMVILSALLDPTVLNVLPANIAHWLLILGAALTAVGLRSAIATGPTVSGNPTTPAVAASKGKDVAE